MAVNRRDQVEKRGLQPSDRSRVRWVRYSGMDRGSAAAIMLYVFGNGFAIFLAEFSKRQTDHPAGLAANNDGAGSNYRAGTNGREDEAHGYFLRYIQSLLSFDQKPVFADVFARPQDIAAWRAALHPHEKRCARMLSTLLRDWEWQSAVLEPHRN